MHELTEILKALATPGCQGALATLVSVQGSSYRRPGARLLWRPGAQVIGAISGGCLEADIIARCASVFEARTPCTLVYDTSQEEDLLWGVGLGCHGTVRVTIEPVGPVEHPLLEIARAWEGNQPAVTITGYARTGQAVTQGTLDIRLQSAHGLVGAASALLRTGKSDTWEDRVHEGAAYFAQYHDLPERLLIAGAGDDAIPLARMASLLGWRTTVADFRRGYATAERFPLATSCLECSPSDLSSHPELLNHSLAVIMTHHYVHDAPWLGFLAERSFKYIGLLGPKDRAQRLLADLEREGRAPSQEFIAGLHAPVGLDLGGDGAAAVALSIIAGMQAAVNARSGRPLRERTLPIHHER